MLKDAKKIKVSLLGIDEEVEFYETEIFEHTEEDGKIYDAAITTDGRLIVWNDGANSWIQVKRWA
jgi:glucose/arabinose dehydrogenase